MDIKNSFALRKKRELLGGINKRKMSLRKQHLKQSECRLDITQITKCVFLGALCLKPVPQLFDSPILLEELDTKVGNVRSDTTVNNENDVRHSTSSAEKQITIKDSSKKGIRKRNLNSSKIKKKSLRERNESKLTNGVDTNIKNEISVEHKSTALISVPDAISTVPVTKTQEVARDESTPNSLIDNTNEVPSTDTAFHVDGNIKQGHIDPEPNWNDVADSIMNEQSLEHDTETPSAGNITDLKPNESQGAPISSKVESENVPPDIKLLNSLSFHYEDVERLKREPTPELILSDSDEDAIDQLMFNIMDIKVGPNDFDQDFFDIPSSNSEEYNEYPAEESPKKTDNDTPKEKMKRTPQCKICSQIFPNYIQLNKHKKTHNGDKPYLCLKCNENHTTLDQLIAHLRTHQGKRPYVCKKCNKGFKTTKALEDHQPVHVLRKAVPQKKAFQCEVCGKEFRKLCDLERHTRVHTGEKPSVCNICNRRFQQAHNLNKHLLIHTKEKPFECDICNKKFGRNDVLNRHLLTHSVKKPNRCNICMKSFIRSSQLFAHKVKFHPEPAS